jgi:hypothetical protein
MSNIVITEQTKTSVTVNGRFFCIRNCGWGWVAPYHQNVGSHHYKKDLIKALAALA